VRICQKFHRDAFEEYFVLVPKERVTLAEGQGVAIQNPPPYFRMSIATSLDVIEEGCSRIASAVSQLS
jgi:bifunctional pyridoxal-dependent enzyme with beta-cystathionase and maltose regulon repressor activities